MRSKVCVHICGLADTAPPDFRRVFKPATRNDSCAFSIAVLRVCIWVYRRKNTLNRIPRSNALSWLIGDRALSSCAARLKMTPRKTECTHRQGAYPVTAWVLELCIADPLRGRATLRDRWLAQRFCFSGPSVHPLPTKGLAPKVTLLPRSSYMCAGHSGPRTLTFIHRPSATRQRGCFVLEAGVADIVARSEGSVPPFL